ncbi:MAG: RHS repeat-associated core domain-containing protein [Cellulosilyticaceae bacterium]
MRAEIEENNRLTKFIFHQDTILAELDTEDTIKARLVRGHGIVAANISGVDNNYYYHQDEQGSTAIITDENADIKNSYHYDAFGKILESQETLPNRITYTGQQYDPLTQQYYLRARYYNPIIGRFTQEDIYRGDGLNLYAYCSNNPVSYYDPSGYAKEASPLCKTPAVTEAEGGDTKGAANWTKGIKATQEVIPDTNVPKSFVMEGKFVNGKEVWVHGNATKHMGQYINSAKGSVLVENEMMQSFKSAVDQALTKPLQPGKNFFDNIGGWEIGINGETGVIYHALMN